MINMVKLPTNKSSLFLRVAKGHFATSHSHINYYIVLCWDGTQVIGTCLANELTKDGFSNMNAHQTIYVITPEYTTGSQIILRDNLAPMVKGKHVLILAASITTGYTAQAAIEAVNYYGGMVAGLSITPASIPANAPCARRASTSTPSSTASVTRHCNRLLSTDPF